MLFVSDGPRVRSSIRYIIANADTGVYDTIKKAVEY